MKKKISIADILDKNSLKILAGLLILTFFAYSPSFKNNFTNWDDNKYVTENPAVQKLSAANIRAIFSRPQQGNYIPLTFLSFAVNHSISKTDPFGYIFTNLLLHLFNTVLLFFILARLMRSRLVALVACSFFALNPIHVESVAWITERKDVLYLCFFLLAILFYLQYLERFSLPKYFLAFLFFILACLSKPAAISLAASLIAIDLFAGRKPTDRRALLEKIPFLLTAVLFALIGMKAVNTNTAEITAYHLNIVERMTIGCRNLVMYAAKIIFPVNLSAYYPYPFRPGEPFPASLWLYPAGLLGACAGLLYYFRSNRAVLFGTGFFAINIFLALQIFPVGDIIMADRFAYGAAPGIYLIIGYASAGFLAKRSFIPLIVLVPFLAFFGVSTAARCKVWNNDETLWTDAIQKNANVPLAYYNRGSFRLQHGDVNGAVKDFTDAAAHRQDYKDAFYGRGVAYFSKSRYDSAEADFTSALKIDPVYTDALFNRALTRSLLNKLPFSEKDFSDFILLKGTADAYSERGLVRYKMKNVQGALEDYNKAIALDAKQADAYARRGLLKLEKRDTAAACVDFRTAYSLGSGLVKDVIGSYCK